MALSGTFYGPWLGSGYQRVYLTWSATQNIANNTSTITASLVWDNTSGSSLSSSVAKTASVSIGGVVAGSTSTAVVGISGGTQRTIVTGSRTVNHNSDGTLSVAISGTFDIKFTLGGTYYASTSASGTATLDTIPRASAITSFPNFTIGSGVTVAAARASTNFTNEYHIYVGGTPIHATAKLAADSYTFTAAQLDGMYSHIPNSTSLLATVYVNTYNGTTLIGQTSASAVASVGSNIIPTFTSVTAAETVTAVANLALGSNQFAQGLSRIKFTVNGAAGVKSSSIASYNINFNGVNYGQNGVTGAINKTGNITATATVTDSRGRTSAAQTVTVNLHAYSNPSATFNVVRNATTATTVNTSGSATISSLNSKNQLTYKVEYKLKTATTWTVRTAAATLPAGTLTYSPVFTYTGHDTTLSYDYRLTITDKVGGSVVATANIGTEAVPMSWSKTGIAAGKVWEQGALDVGGQSYFDNIINLTNGSARRQINMGSFYSAASTNTGAIWIEIGTSNTMFNAHINIRAYDCLADIHVGGYTYIANAHWHSPRAQGNVVGPALNIRFATASTAVGSKRYIVIGDTNTVWGGYLHVTVDDVTVGYGTGFSAPFPITLATTYPANITTTIDISPLTVLNGKDLILRSKAGENDPGDIVFANGDGVEQARIYTTTGGLTYREGAASPGKSIWHDGIIDRGSNANGWYIRYPDGTQICWNSYDVWAGTTTAWGGMFISGQFAAAFPVGFYVAPSFYANWNNAAGDSNTMMIDIIYSTSARFRIARGTTMSSSSGTMRWMAIGRWKA